jgi:hypothetical protein
MTYAEKTNRFVFKIDPDNECIVGQDGCHYDSEAEAMYFAQTGLCGCGSPEDVHQMLIDCLTAVCDGELSTIIDYKKVVEIIKANPETMAQFVLHFLDKVNLTEHGGSVYGSWLTERGKQFVEVGVMKDDEE